MKNIGGAGAGLLLAGALLSASAQAQPAKVEQPEAFKRLVQCRGISDSAARLQCFDAASAAVAEAADRQELVVVDKKQILESRRSLFGLSIPNFKLFGGSESDEIKTVQSKLSSVRRDADGRMVMRLEDGSTWRQMDDVALGRDPKSGHKVEINRAALGSYMMRVEGQPGIRVKRQS